MTKELSLREKIKSVTEIKVFAVDKDNNVVSKFKVKKDAKNQVAKCFYTTAVRVLNLVEERKENKEKNENKG